MNAQPSPAGLTDIERSILEVERLHWKYLGAKEAFIRDRFGWSPVRHFQKLHALIQRPEAMAYDPQTVRRVQRLVEQRRTQRGGQ
jgi:hypothetical protein